jgi:competence protein ComEC
MVRPFLYPVCSLALGIWLGPRLGLPAGRTLWLAGTILAAGWVAFILTKADHIVIVCLLLASLFLGAAAFTIADKTYEANPAHRFAAEGYVDFTGRISRSPSRGTDRDYLYLSLEKVETGGREEVRRGNLRVTLPRSEAFPGRARFLTGDRVRLSARVVVPAESMNFGPAVSAAYLKSQRLHNLAFCKSALLVQKLGSAGCLSPLRIASRLRQALQDRIEGYFSERGSGTLSQPGAVLEALLLGERRRMDDDVTLVFQESGLLHLIAISGAHIGIISMLLLGLFRLAGLAPRPSAAALILILVFYSLLVEGSASVLRATIMAVSFLLGRLIWREANILNSLALSALVLLLDNPFNLFDPGFQLTYAATLSIILFQAKILRRLPRLPLKIGDMLALSAAAQAGVIPLVAMAFNRVALAPLVLNLAAVPLVAVIMAAGYVFFPLAFAADILALPLAAALKALIALLLGISRLSEASSLLSYRVPNPGFLAVIGYYVFLLALLTPKRVRFQAHVLGAAWTVWAFVIAVYPFPADVSSFRVTFLDVGQGDSILLELPGRLKMLVDGGGTPTGSFDPGERVVSPFLWRKGIKRLDLVVATHAHPDHIKGLQATARNFRPAELWESAASVDGELHQSLLNALPRRAVRREMQRGTSRETAGVRVEALHPGPGSLSLSTGENDRSLVLRLSRGRTSFLLAGDIERAAESELAGNSSNMRSGVLKVPHHGSGSSSGAAFLSRVSPRIAVITVGRGNTYGFPQEEVLRRLRASGAVIYRTDRDGAVEITSDGWSYAVRTALHPERVRIFRGDLISAPSPEASPVSQTARGSGVRYTRRS